MLTLVRGQTIALRQETGNQALSKITMGLGWDPIKPKGFFATLLSGNKNIDLDASCALFDADKKPLDFIWYNKLKSTDGSIVHTGDNETGSVGGKDAEQIIVDLQTVPFNVKYLVFTVNSFEGHTFNEIDNAYCRVVNNANGQEIARYELSGGGNHTAMVMAKLSRDSKGEWEMLALGESTVGQEVSELIPTIVSLL
ncbi:MAG: tellurium resistance TerZ family protein [Deltaproteobacteria bacterium]|jgi:tellurium resistance protein TerZ|nr:tellurium resistance TerZ family protein [Deltaproteobacteria bacterium]